MLLRVRPFIRYLMSITPLLDWLGKSATKIDDPNTLKTYQAQVRHNDWQNDSFAPDLRYSTSTSGELTGLHVSHLPAEQVAIFWNLLQAALPQIAATLEVLYLTEAKGDLILENFNALRFLQLGQSAHLRSLQIQDAPVLVELHAGCCPELQKVTLNGNLQQLEKVDLSKGKVHTFELSELPKLRYLILFGNQLTHLDLRHLPRLEYLLALDNPIVEILWPRGEKVFEYLELLELPETYDSGSDALNGFLRDGAEKLRAYFKQLHNGKFVKQHRLKILLLGNTTAGKSTLRRIFRAAKGEEATAAKAPEESTHGAKVFEEKIPIDGKDFYVQLFDFGGQDYYHATHLPFYQRQTLHLLLYGSLPDGPLSAYAYGHKEVEGREEVLFPLQYWLGSIRHHQKEPSESQDTGPEVRLIQNRFDGQPKQFLNVHDLLQQPGLRLSEPVEYDFHTHAQALKDWLHAQIAEHAHEREISAMDYTFYTEVLKAEGKVLITLKEAISLFKERFNSSTLGTALALESLHYHHLGYWMPVVKDEDIQMSLEVKKFIGTGFDKWDLYSEERSFFVYDLSIFSDWIHTLLSKEVLTKYGGYLTKATITLSDEAKDHQDRLLDFLLQEKVIFEVKDESDKWVAPSYLPPPSTTVEELFLDSFDTPDVKIFLREYFHAHLIHILIGEFKDQNILVKDPKQQKYLLWKNKILLYEAAENERALLLIELLYPHEPTHEAYCRADEPSDCPILLIRRNHSGLVPNSRFGQVFQFIKEQLDKRASHTEYWLKTKHGNYIPYTSLPRQEKGTIDKKEKSAFVYHDQTFYPVHDFRMYLDG